MGKLVSYLRILPQCKNFSIKLSRIRRPNLWQWSMTSHFSKSVNTKTCQQMNDFSSSDSPFKSYFCISTQCWGKAQTGALAERQLSGRVREQTLHFHPNLWANTHRQTGKHMWGQMWRVRGRALSALVFYRFKLHSLCLLQIHCDQPQWEPTIHGLLNFFTSKHDCYAVWGSKGIIWLCWDLLENSMYESFYIVLQLLQWFLVRLTALSLEFWTFSKNLNNFSPEIVKVWGEHLQPRAAFWHLHWSWLWQKSEAKLLHFLINFYYVLFSEAINIITHMLFFAVVFLFCFVFMRHVSSAKCDFTHFLSDRFYSNFLCF